MESVFRQDFYLQPLFGNNRAAVLLMEWLIRHFDELTIGELYAILRLRSRVFVVEQQCIFLDMDNLDQQCHHLTGMQRGQLVACTRLVPPGLAYEHYMSIGRVVTAPEVRRTGLGVTLMEQSIDACFRIWGPGPIKIGAQLYLKQFYESLGFVPSGAAYDEDGIPHIPMLRPGLG